MFSPDDLNLINEALAGRIATINPLTDEKLIEAYEELLARIQRKLAWPDVWNEVLPDFDERTYEERHTNDTFPEPICRMLLKFSYPEFLGFTEVVQGMLERDLDRYSMPTFQAKVAKVGGLRAYAKDIIAAHAAWGVDA